MASGAVTAEDSPEALPLANLAAECAVPTPRVKRQNAQLLADELIADELAAADQASKNGRVLSQDKDLWSHNAWDRIEWDQEQEQYAQERVAQQMQTAVPAEVQQELNENPASYWDQFYANVKDGFFNDRAWLANEFPELAAAGKADAGPKTVVELGCGPGNTLYPLHASSENPHLRLHGYDYSKEAVDLVKSNSAYDPNVITSAVWDLSSKSGLPPTLEPESVDIAVMIFVFSALHPSEWEQAVRNVYAMLKPGGTLLFRDYGRNDMAQLRFKSNRFMQPGLYIRGDKTRVYFFERDELVRIFGGLKKPSESTDGVPLLGNLSLGDSSETRDSTSTSQISTASNGEPENNKSTMSSNGDNLRVTDSTASSPLLVPGPKFELVHLGVDRRLLLNRKKKIKMMRVWMQGRWRKPINETARD